MNELNLTQLNSYCNILVNNTYYYYQELKEAFQLLSLTGCRVSEIFEIDRWEYYSPNTYSLQPQKGNNLRLISLGSNCMAFQAAILGQYPPFLGRTVDQLQQYFDSTKMFGALYSGNKPISLYIFRYTFIKNLQASGYTLEQIASEMGYTSNDTPLAYLTAKIYENLNIPPPTFSQIGNMLFSNNNIAINDGGGGIYSLYNENSWWCGLYYTYDAAVRIASLFPELRIPSYGDWYDMLAFAGGGSIVAEKYKYFGTSYWSTVSPTAANFCSLNLKGSGYFLNGIFYNLYRFCFFHMLQRNPGSYDRFSLTYANNGLNASGGLIEYVIPLRLCSGNVF